MSNTNDIFNLESASYETALKKDETNYLEQFKNTKCKVVFTRGETKDGRIYYQINAHIKMGLIVIPLSVKAKKPIESSMYANLCINLGIDFSKVSDSTFRPYRLVRVNFVDKNTGSIRAFFKIEVLMYSQENVDDEGNTKTKHFVLSGILSNSQKQLMNTLANLPKEKEVKNLGMSKTDWKIYNSTTDEVIDDMNEVDGLVSDGEDY